MRRRGSGESESSPKLARRERAADSPVREIIRGTLLALLVCAAWSTTYILRASPEQIAAVVGEPSPRDIKAPRQVAYISETKTQGARLAAMAKVEDTYTGPDMRIASEQVKTLREYTNYVTAIRLDPLSARESNLELLREIPNLDLSRIMSSRIADLKEDEWQGVITETLRVLELAMREEIRPDQRIEAQRRAQRLVTHTLSDDQRAVVIAFTQSMVVPNSFFDAEQTASLRAAARNAVEPVHSIIREGESIVREGEIVTNLALEELHVLGLLSTGPDWQAIAGVVLLSLITVITLSIYVIRTQPLLLSRPRRQLLLALILTAIGVAAYIVIPGRTLVPYLFPAAAGAMLVAILLDIQLAMVVSAATALLVALNAGGSIELATYALIGGVIGSLAIWRMEHLGTFIRATGYIALVNVAIILSFRLPSQTYNAVALVQLLGAAIINAILSSSLTFVAFSFIGRLFGIATSLQLLELARPNHPLFRQLLISAPGTYHHSIVISNMAERAAEAIGADALLARVGSYYHDIGKTLRPYFFSENQTDGVNPHDKLDPKTSAEIVISHTADGLALARKHKLPEKVCDFIPEHHGTTLATYFYRRANQENDGQDVDEADFRYPGPRPQSKETAIVMLADSVEAWVRSNRPSTQAEMERVIRRVINDRLIGGQLDECDLTLNDLGRIREAFISVLQGVFHPRIQYPERTSRRNNSRPTDAPASSDASP